MLIFGLYCHSIGRARENQKAMLEIRSKMVRRLINSHKLLAILIYLLVSVVVVVKRAKCPPLSFPLHSRATKWGADMCAWYLEDPEILLDLKHDDELYIIIIIISKKKNATLNGGCKSKTFNNKTSFFRFPTLIPCLLCCQVLSTILFHANNSCCCCCWHIVAKRLSSKHRKHCSLFTYFQ